ncbi:MgtC/SapB family protein [Hyphococcus sp.]|uniref:MgtC/SapB family protein n=1 Tax=Hyphococcus sp. TaxID=2038636 RepID=UPI003D14FEC8
MPDFASDPMMTDLVHLAVALAIGFLIGFEREHSHAEEARQHTFAGARTFSLTALAGGLSGLVDEGLILPSLMLFSLAGLTAVAYWATAREKPGAGGTTEIALLLTFLLGLAAVRGHVMEAAIGGVSTAIILSIKQSVQRWATALTEEELYAALRLLAISVIILPVLPDEAFGPYDALNLRDIWLMVVFISGLSFLGYWLIKLAGSGRGVLLTGFVGGLASSTATTLSLSRFAKSGVSAGELAAGIVAANVMMLIRIGVLVAALARDVLVALAPGLVAAALAGGAGVLWLRRGREPMAEEAELDLGNPMEIKPALIFAALLAVISVAASFGAEQFGQSGLMLVALISGLADVDAITLIAGRKASGGEIGMGAAAYAIMIAAASNIVLKAGMASVIGGKPLGLRVGAIFAAMIAAGAAALLVL